MDLNQLKLFMRQRIIGFDVPDRPWFDSDATTAWFLEMLSSANRYLEYGTGGSTYAAAKLGVDFIAVDSDPYFLRQVRKKIERHGYLRASGQEFRHADIGRTGPWGRPVGAITNERLELFRAYSDPPAMCLHEEAFPDLVLIDGRFRVACALKVVRMLRTRPSWTVVVDDYAGRPGYHVIADYAELGTCVGRMAVFTSAKERTADEWESAIRTYESVVA